MTTKNVELINISEWMRREQLPFQWYSFVNRTRNSITRPVIENYINLYNFFSTENFSFSSMHAQRLQWLSMEQMYVQREHHLTCYTYTHTFTNTPFSMTILTLLMYIVPVHNSWAQACHFVVSIFKLYECYATVTSEKDRKKQRIQSTNSNEWQISTRFVSFSVNPFDMKRNK